jgi:hypothetical protein
MNFSSHFNQPQFQTLVLALIISLGCPLALQAQDVEAITQKISLGSHFSTGNYGAEEKTDILFFPVSYELAKFPWVLTVTAPYLGLKGPGDVFLETGNIGRGRTGTNEIIDEKGLGDLVIAASYQFPPIFKGWVFVDLTLQAKLPTADETRDLGTGETDYGYQLDFYTTLDRNTWFSSIGYRNRGKTPLFDLENSTFASLGYMRQYGERTYAGLIYDYRERASSNSFESHEIMPFVSYNLTEKWNLMVYAIAGFTDSSADRAFGLQLSYTLP